MEREGEREREHQINRVRDTELDRNGNGMGQILPLAKMDVGVFLVIQINRTNKLSIKLGGSQILQFLWCRNIRSHNDMFRHNLTKLMC
jgi:hypothetical protein